MTNHGDSVETRINTSEGLSMNEMEWRIRLFLNKQWNEYLRLLEGLKSSDKVEHNGKVFEGDMWIVDDGFTDKCYRIISADTHRTMGNQSFEMLAVHDGSFNNHATWEMLFNRGVLIYRGSGEMLFDITNVSSH